MGQQEQGDLSQGPGQPLPHAVGQREGGNSGVKHGGDARQLPYTPRLALIPLRSRVFLQSRISSALAQSNNPVKGWVAVTEAAN